MRVRDRAWLSALASTLACSAGHWRVAEFFTRQCRPDHTNEATECKSVQEVHDSIVKNVMRGVRCQVEWREIVALKVMHCLGQWRIYAGEQIQEKSGLLRPKALVLRLLTCL